MGYQRKMLSRFGRSQGLLQCQIKRNIISYVKMAMNMHNTDSEQYQIARADSTLPLGSLVQHVVEGRQPNVQVTNLDNGITVVSESPVFPGTVDVNILLNVGTRDEQESESGSCLSMRNSYLKTILATNE